MLSSLTATKHFLPRAGGICGEWLHPGPWGYRLLKCHHLFGMDSRQTSRSLSGQLCISTKLSLNTFPFIHKGVNGHLISLCLDCQGNRRESRARIQNKELRPASQTPIALSPSLGSVFCRASSPLPPANVPCSPFWASGP